MCLYVSVCVCMCLYVSVCALYVHPSICRTLPHNAIPCSPLQHAKTYTNTPQHTEKTWNSATQCNTVLQCVMMCGFVRRLCIHTCRYTDIETRRHCVAETQEHVCGDIASLRHTSMYTHESMYSKVPPFCCLRVCVG